MYRTYRDCSNLNILVFPNQQIQIKDIYQPLTLTSTKNQKRYKVTTFSKTMIDNYKKILISDSAGMGKSTLMKWISISIIEQSLSIPILIELKKINRKHLLIDEIFRKIDPIDKSFDKDLIIKFLELGSFTLLFDGFDEVEYDERETVIEEIRSLTSKANNNWYILTSRPDSVLSSFGDFQLLNINPLSKNEAFDLIDKYDAVNNNHLSENLKKDIELKLTQVSEFLSNPFLISLLYKTYTYNKDIPSKKSTFYDEVYSALYKHHDLSKDGYKRNKKSGLDIHDFRIVLRKLAFITSKVAKTEYTDIQLLEYLKDIKKSLSFNFKELSYSEDLESNVPLFVRDGRNLKWSHKSVQDYFAAEYICNHPQKKDIVHKIYESQKSNYLQILDYIFELEPQIFREVIILPILRKFVSYCTTSYCNCKISKKEIRKRQSMTFGILFGMQNKGAGTEWFHKIRNENDRKIGDFSLYSVSVDENGIAICATNYDQEIINLIGNKGTNYTFKIKRKNRRGLIEKIDINLKSEATFFVNDNPDCIFNEPEIFDTISDLIMIGSSSYFLDYDKSLAVIESIETQLKLEAENDILEGI